jgi:hypothetical protein
MLNANSLVSTFGDAKIPWQRAFIRPTDDSKCFPGMIILREEFITWQDKVQLSEFKDTQIQIAEPQVILQEYRFWIVDGEIVTQSMYKQGSQVVYNELIPNYMHQFVKDRVKEYQPHRAFVIDVALLENGCLKIVEINTINAAGFYAADINKLVIKLEESFNL